MSDRNITDRLGKFVIKGVLGRGAMGTVYDGWDPQIDRRVAIKTVKLQVDADDEEATEGLARFKREAQAAGRLSHENIVGVFDYGETDEIAYIVMEFVEGRSLKTLVDPGLPLPPEQAAELMLQVLSGLDYSHRRGVVHRDIKPANVMLTLEGKVKLADFGIAKITSSSMTSVGVILGTPAYMPPEQFLGEPAESRSDIYAAGAMLFHMLTGKRPYEGNPTSIMQRVLNAPGPPHPSERAIGLSPAWDRVIDRAMARRPEDRFETAAAFAEGIRQALSGAAPAPAALGPLMPEDQDATIMVSTATRAVSPKPAPPAAPLPTPAPVAKPAKAGGPPIGLIAGGIGAVVVLGGVAAWFLRPSPAPVVAPAPKTAVAPIQVPTPAPPPVATPSPQAVRDALAAATAGIPCSAVEASVSGSGVSLSGIAGNGTPMDAVTKAAAAAALPVALSVKGFPGTYCAAIDVLRPIMQSNKLDFTVPEPSPVSSSVMIHPTIANLPFNAWLQVDYLSGDGTLLHVLPRAGDPAQLLPAGSGLRLGQAPHIGLEPAMPYGTDMIIAIASSEKLFPGLRSDSESGAAYAAALQAAVAKAKADGAQLAGGVVVLTTEQ